MKQPKQLSPKAVELIMPLLLSEFTAFYQYRAMSNYCQGVGYEKAAAFFLKESEDELTHAKKLEKILVDWNVVVELPMLEAPKTEFTDLVDVIETAYEMEYDLYELYNDKLPKVMAMNQGLYIKMYELMDNQFNAVAEYSDKLNMLEGVDPTKTNLLLLEEKLF